MFDQSQTKELQKLGLDFLKKIKESHSVGARQVEQLRSVLRFHEYRYYVLNDPLITDVEYDILYKQLEKI